MISKPDNWGSIEPQTTGEFSRPSAGAYVFGILKDEHTTSKNKNEMIVLSLDIAEGEFKGHYKNLSEHFKSDNLLKHYRVVSEQSMPYFKGDIKAIEESNKGYEYNFSEGSLRGKLVGGMLREEEYINKNGEKKTILKIMFLCSVEKARSGKLTTPDIKRLDTSFNEPPPTTNYKEEKLPWE
jgi:hypothetical protein